MHKRIIALCFLTTVGCLGDPNAPTSSDAGYLAVPDLSSSCQTDNDGVLQRVELPLVIGASARYLQNPDGTVAAIDPVGQDSPDGTAWDYTSSAGVAIDLPISALAGAWY
jgi:hypothetical protein